MENKPPGRCHLRPAQLTEQHREQAPESVALLASATLAAQLVCTGAPAFTLPLAHLTNEGLQVLEKSKPALCTGWPWYCLLGLCCPSTHLNISAFGFGCFMKDTIPSSPHPTPHDPGLLPVDSQSLGPHHPILNFPHLPGPSTHKLWRSKASFPIRSHSILSFSLAKASLTPCLIFINLCPLWRSLTVIRVLSTGSQSPKKLSCYPELKPPGQFSSKDPVPLLPCLSFPMDRKRCRQLHGLPFTLSS